MIETPKHPAKYNDRFFEVFANQLKGYEDVLDPFAGTGKIGKLKEYGYTGKIYANEIEPEWLIPNKYHCDVLTFEDAETLKYAEGKFSAICTSPTYGNRMADHHVAKDGSKRLTYTHSLGHPLNEENTGRMQWGNHYREKHVSIYRHLYSLLKDGGKLIINVKNHIRNGKMIDVCGFHKDVLVGVGFKYITTISVATQSLRYGANGKSRVSEEQIMVFVK